VTRLLTADTVTNAQIRALRETTMNGSPIAESCAVALGDLVLDGTDVDVEIAEARARCADALNTRMKWGHV